MILVLGRGVQGLGGGGMLPLSQSIVADAVPPRERGCYQSYIGFVWIVAGSPDRHLAALSPSICIGR